ncbi:MAG: NAD-dependent epimerase/dehydratase family protein [Endomicrobiia bacterium]
MKILVTGANGFIGSHIVEKFLQKGEKVRCLVHKNLTWLKDKPVELFYGSITHPETLPDAVKDIDFVFHCAAVLRVVKTQEYYEINHIGTKNLIETVYRYAPNIKRFVYISSQAAMGPSQETNKEECPVSDYGRSKLLGEKEVLKFKGKIPVAVLRPAAVYGPRDVDLLPFFKMVQKGIFPVLTGDENCVVQLLFVNDLVEICYIITQKNTLSKDIYFLAENKPYTWQEIGKIIAKISNKKIKIFVLPVWFVKTMATISEFTMKLKNKPAKLNRDKVKEFCQNCWIADSSLSEKEFNFKFTELEIGARITYNWYKEKGWIKNE